MDRLIVDQIKRIIFAHGRGWCFSSRDFSSLGSDDAIRQALSRLQRRKIIRRIAWGVYDYPRVHDVLGDLPPDIQQVVQAAARKNQMKVTPSGAYAANLLGLSDHVPAKLVYLTDGPSKNLQIGNQSIVFKKTTPRYLSSPGSFGGLVVQALRFLGKDHVDDQVVAVLRNRMKNQDRRSVLRAGASAPVWINRILTDVAGDDAHG